MGKTFVISEWLRKSHNAHPTQISIIEAQEKSGISVAQIRDLYRGTRGKLTRPQYYILRHAHHMSPGAQNAFLKLLEEPNEHVFFILTVPSPDDVLPTIQSRTQHLAIAPIAPNELQTFLTAHYKVDAAALAQILFIAGGRPKVALQLASDPTALGAHRDIAGYAKALVSGTAFERLIAVNAVGGDRQKAMATLELCAQMATKLLAAATTKSQAELLARCELINETLERLNANANVKIQLTRFALSGE